MNILVCTNAINDWYRKIIKYGLRNLKRYCMKHNYQCIIHTEQDKNTVYDGKRDYPWYKIPLIKRVLLEYDCDYIVWIDADTQILRNDIKLEYFIEKFLKDKDICLTQDVDILNTGIIFMKCTQFNIDLMDKIWNNPNQFDPNFHEQASLAEIYKRDEYVKKHVEIIPYGVKDELIVYWGNYFPEKTFLLHAARCSEDKLGFMYMMDGYYPYRLDEENDEEYNYRIEWLFNERICRKDIDRWLKGEFAQRRYSVRCKKYIETKHL